MKPYPTNPSPNQSKEWREWGQFIPQHVIPSNPQNSPSRMGPKVKVVDVPGMGQGSDFNQNWKATQQQWVVMVVFTVIIAVIRRHGTKTGAVVVEPKLIQRELAERTTRGQTVMPSLVCHHLPFWGVSFLPRGITVPGSLHLPFHPSFPESLLRPCPRSLLQSWHQTGILPPSPAFSRPLLPSEVSFSVSCFQ